MIHSIRILYINKKAFWFQIFIYLNFQVHGNSMEKFPYIRNATATINKMKRQPTEGEKMFANHIFTKVLIPQNTKNSIKKQTNNLI